MSENNEQARKFNPPNLVAKKEREKTDFLADDDVFKEESVKSEKEATIDSKDVQSDASTSEVASVSEVPKKTAKTERVEEDVKDPYYEPTKSAKLSEDVLTKVKILMPFIQREHGFALRANNSFIDVMIDYFIENGLDESDRALFMDYYEASINNRK